MVLRAHHIAINSAESPAIVVERLRARASEWRESTVTEGARAAGIIGWILREDGERLILRPRIMGQNAWLPIFVGQVRATPSGSEVLGELRLNWFSRAFMFLWFAAVICAPILPLFEPLPDLDATVGWRLLMAAFMLGPAIALGVAGNWMMHRGWDRPSAAIEDVLLAVSHSTPRDAEATPASGGV